jgi:hypothetical protein
MAPVKSAALVFFEEFNGASRDWRTISLIIIAVSFQSTVNFRNVEDQLGIPISGTRGFLIHITGRPRARAVKIKKESGKEFHFPFMLGNL